MVDPRLHELIQHDIDGQLSPAERAELARALLENQEARRLRDELGRLDASLRDLPAEPAPAGLKDIVLESIFGTPRAEETAGPASGRGAAVLFRYAAVFLGGLVVASMAFYLSEPSGPADPRDLAGTMAKGTLYGDLAADASLEAGASEAATRLYRSGRRVVLELKTAGEGPSEVEITYDPATLTVVGVVPGVGSAGADEPAAGRLRLEGLPGLRRIHFEGPESGEIRLDVALQSAAGDRAQETLTASAQR
jgi:anti-sigma factor RsiW